MSNVLINILLADDDEDDCLLFKEALEEIPFTTNLAVVHDGVQLMKYLTQNLNTLPDILYLDLNMPGKNGLECLSEIKKHNALLKLPIIIYSTSFKPGAVNELQQKGAQHYIRKPAEFLKLRNVILKSLILLKDKKAQNEIKNFILSA